MIGHCLCFVYVELYVRNVVILLSESAYIAIIYRKWLVPAKVYEILKYLDISHFNLIYHTDWSQWCFTKLLLKDNLRTSFIQETVLISLHSSMKVSAVGTLIYHDSKLKGMNSGFSTNIFEVVVKNFVYFF